MGNVKYKSAIAAGIVAGSAIGLVTGLLVAPKSGDELRGDIADKTQEGIDTAKDKISDAKDAAKNKVGAVADKIT